MKTRSCFPEIMRVAALAAFSLVEVVLALGICSFAMVAIIGMIPVGMTTFKDAMNTTVQSQILQRIAGEVLLTEYTNLAEEPTLTFYNDQGAVLDSPDRTLAYTAKVFPPETISESSLTGSRTPGEKVTIQIARTPPGQTFDVIELNAPHQIFSYSVIVSRGH